MEFAAPELGSTRRLQGHPVQDYVTSTSGHIVGVVAYASHPKRRVLSITLGISIVWFLFSVMTSHLTFFARPACSLPIISFPFSHFNGPPTYAGAGRPVCWADYPKLVDLQAKTFGQLLDESVGYGGFMLEVKKGERLSNNVVVLLGVSGLNSKDQITERLSKLVDDARMVGRSLHSLGAKIQGAVDS